MSSRRDGAGRGAAGRDAAGREAEQTGRGAEQGRTRRSTGPQGAPRGSTRQSRAGDSTSQDGVRRGSSRQNRAGDSTGQDSAPQSGAGPEEPGLERPEAVSDGWQKQLTGLGGFIRMQRRLADLSLREMANLTSVSNAYLSQIERGLHQPSLRVLRSIAQALSIAPEDLLRRANFLSPKDDSRGPTAPGPPGPSGPAASPGAADSSGPSAPLDTEEAIKADPRLTPAQRDALLNVYRSFREQS